MATIKKKFDFTRYKRRHIALKILYFGWDYNGLAQQLDDKNTVEYHLFEALTRTCLIESRENSNYNRCGRTDKGVSSSGQVVNLDVRSNLVNEEANIGLFTPDGYRGQELESIKLDKTELDFVGILNRVLPEYIKVLAWSPVREGFSSRFDCQSRSYSYVFPIGDLSVDFMKEALTYLVGEHDFRNLCSFDLKNNVTNHKRTIVSADIKPISFDTSCDNNPRRESYGFYEITITGQAFLYHQIRCIMTVIFLVGSRKECPGVVKDLLDLEKCPAKPNYNKASPIPLCLFDCQFNPDLVPGGWIYTEENLRDLRRRLKCLWLRYKTKTLLIEKALFGLPEPNNDHDGAWKDFGLECDNMKDTRYITLLKRPRDDTLESKLESMTEKKRLREK